MVISCVVIEGLNRERVFAAMNLQSRLADGEENKSGHTGMTGQVVMTRSEKD
jgi:hypothetical protein